MTVRNTTLIERVENTFGAAIALSLLHSEHDDVILTAKMIEDFVLEEIKIANRQF